MLEANQKHSRMLSLHVNFLPFTYIGKDKLVVKLVNGKDAKMSLVI